MRAARFEKDRENKKYRGVSKESKMEMQMKQKRMSEAEKAQEERGGSNANMQW